MADGIELAVGTIETDQLLSGKHVQFIKIMDGTADGTSKAQVSSDGLHVNVTKVSADPFGTTADAAVAAGAAGSISAKLRAISRDLAANIVLAAGSVLIGRVQVRNTADSANIDPIAETTFTGRVGEVQGSPTANTLLARLKDLLTGISLAAGSAVIGAVTQSGTWTVTQSGAWAVTAANAAGDVAHDGVDVGNPVKQGFQARTTSVAAVADADRVNGIATVTGKQIVKLDAVPDLTWAYAAAAGGLVNTTGVVAKAAAGAGVRNYVKSIDVENSHQTISTEVVIRDGAAGTVLWRGWAQAAGGRVVRIFDPPLRGSANTLVEIAEISATATAGVLMNPAGFQAAE